MKTSTVVHSVLLLSLVLFSLAAAKESHKKSNKRSLKSCYRKATLTQYWIPKEGDKDMLNDGKIVTLTGPKVKELKTKYGKTIAKVSKITYEVSKGNYTSHCNSQLIVLNQQKFQMEGTGLLKNGVMVNLDDGDNSFMKVNRKKDPYGLGSQDNALTPWVSVASNDLRYGTKLYIKELDGVKLPQGKTHNGCVRVDDKGWSFGGCQLDFFVLQFTSYQKLENLLPEHVTVTEKSNCKILNYITSSVKKWAVI